MTRRFTTPGLAVSLAVMLAFPAPAVQPAEGEVLAESQSYAFWLQDAPGSLDPAFGTDAASAEVLRSLFEGLVIEDADGAAVPGMAESHEISDDRLTYTFHLREAIWSNGDPVTAGDFVHAWRRVLDPGTSSPNAWVLVAANIAGAGAVAAGEIPPERLGVAALDDRRLQVRLARPAPHFLKTLSHPSTFPVPQRVIEAGGDGWTRPGTLVSNGAFLLESHDPGVEITLTRNPYYWDAENVVMQTLRGLTENDANAALARYRSGELDRVPIPDGQYPALAKALPDAAAALPHACTCAYVFNLSESGPAALKDRRVREALSLALPRAEIIDTVLRGGQRPATTWTHWAIHGFLPPDTQATGSSQSERTARAARLLAEAGVGPDAPLKLTLQYNTDEHHKRLAVAAQQAWKPLGIELSLRNLEWSVHADRLQAREFEIARYGWCADYNDASAFLDWFRSDGVNSGRWVNAEFDALLNEARRANDPGPLYRRAEEILSAEVPAVSVYHYAKAELINPRIRGLARGNALNHWYAKDLYRLAD